jgi:hypothetical protein
MKFFAFVAALTMLAPAALAQAPGINMTVSSLFSAGQELTIRITQGVSYIIHTMLYINPLHLVFFFP